MAGVAARIDCEDRLVTNHSRNAGNLPKIDLNSPICGVILRCLTSQFHRNFTSTKKPLKPVLLVSK